MCKDILTVLVYNKSSIKSVINAFQYAQTLLHQKKFSFLFIWHKRAHHPLYLSYLLFLYSFYIFKNRQQQIVANIIQDIFKRT